ncbi:Hypothetical predicted protein [Marmota monax]|uniref:Uncharacterized protein n=1 Tax=Marmota monax TaxID=9995 RepID=A0A5E4CN55_MARMO|nr:Hypothetical predicted protein [Marmota monax]
MGTFAENLIVIVLSDPQMHQNRFPKSSLDKTRSEIEKAHGPRWKGRSGTGPGLPEACSGLFPPVDAGVTPAPGLCDNREVSELEKSALLQLSKYGNVLGALVVGRRGRERCSLGHRTGPSNFYSPIKVPVKEVAERGNSARGVFRWHRLAVVSARCTPRAPPPAGPGLGARPAGAELAARNHGEEAGLRGGGRGVPAALATWADAGAREGAAWAREARPESSAVRGAGTVHAEPPPRPARPRAATWGPGARPRHVHLRGARREQQRLCRGLPAAPRLRPLEEAEARQSQVQPDAGREEPAAFRETG